MTQKVVVGGKRKRVFFIILHNLKCLHFLFPYYLEVDCSTMYLKIVFQKEFQVGNEHLLVSLVQVQVYQIFLENISI